MYRFCLVSSIVFSVFSPLGLYAADWTYFRGDERASACVDETVSVPDSLKTVWKHSFENGWIQATAIIADETVYIGSSDNGMTAFALSDGKPLWNYPVETGVLASAVYFQDTDGTASLFFGDSEGILYALDARTGKERWKFKTEGTIDNSPNIDREKKRVLVGSQDGTLYALDTTTGKPAWKYKSEDQIRCFPTIVERKCFVAGCDAKFHVVDLDTGTAVTKIELDAPTGSTPAVWKDLVFFGTEGNELLALNWKSGKIVWRYKAKQAFRSPSACKDGFVVVCGMDKTVRCFEAETGELRWEFRTKGRMEQSGAVIAGERVYVPCEDSFLYILDFSTGEKVGDVELDGKLRACPAVIDGGLVIGTDDGVLLRLGK